MTSAIPTDQAARSTTAGRSSRYMLIRAGFALAVICAVAWLVLDQDRSNATKRLEQEGFPLATLIAALPDSVLSDTTNANNVLNVIARSQSQSWFAFISVTGQDGSILSLVGDRSALPPAAPAPTPDLWRQTRMATSNAGRPIMEFRVPIVRDAALHGFVHIGYHQPTISLQAIPLSVLAMIALPVFLLVPLFDRLWRRELRGTQAIRDRINRMGEAWGLGRPLEEQAANPSDFLLGMDRFVALVDQRVEEVEQRENLMRTTSSVLEYRQNRLVAILESIPYGIVVVDDSKLGVVSNQMAARALHRDERQIIGQPVNRWADGALAASLSRARLSSEASDAETFEWQPEPGPEQRTFEVTVQPLRGTPERPANGTLLALSDITDHVLARAARSDFVGHLSHELKAPLQVLGMYAETMKSDMIADPEFQIEAANVIGDEVERLAMLITNMLSLTQIEMGSMSLDRQRVRIGDFLEDVFASATRSAEGSDIQCQLNLSSDLSALSIDKGLMRMAINNLLTNAIKYNRAGGEVRLETEETPEAIYIRVADTGIGMDADDVEHIFERFYRSGDEAAQAASGHGLGLALARDIIQLHHGTIAVDSTKGEGSTFTIRIGKDISVLREAG